MNTIKSKGYKTSLFGKLHLHEWNGDLRDYEDYVHDYGYDVVDEISGPPRSAAKFGSHMLDRWKEEGGVFEQCRDDIASRYKERPYPVGPSVLPLHLYPDVYVANQAIDYLEGYNSLEPWFCTVSFGGPHEPWDAPDDYTQLYDSKAMPSPLKRPVDANSDRPRGIYDGLIKGEYEGDFALKGDLKLTGGDTIGQMRANYAGNITLIDEKIGGELLDVIDKRGGELDNTIVIFTADHGEQNGDYGLIFKQTFLDSSVKVPLIVSGPDMDESIKGAVYDGMVELIDVGPTIVDMMGSKIEYNQYGKSLEPVIKDIDAVHRKSVISEISGEIMLINRQWKAVFNIDRDIYMLFNKESDPLETMNLAGSGAFEDVEMQMAKELSQVLNETTMGCCK